MATALEKVLLQNGKEYFVDRRLYQLRNVINPHDNHQFDSEIDLLAFVLFNENWRV